ncbi:MAG: hypothetical protein R2716_00345 [Microthrixaceae bacterium]
MSGSPSRLVMLFTGSTPVTFSYGIMLYWAIEGAFGIGEGFGDAGSAWSPRPRRRSR